MKAPRFSYVRPESREFLSGNSCRCTGCHAIVDTIEAVMGERVRG